MNNKIFPFFDEYREFNAPNTLNSVDELDWSSTRAEFHVEAEAGTNFDELQSVTGLLHADGISFWGSGNYSYQTSNSSPVTASSFWQLLQK